MNMTGCGRCPFCGELPANLANGLQQQLSTARAEIAALRADAAGGWVIKNANEKNGGLLYRTVNQKGAGKWTPDLEQALRFHRREDAERFAPYDTWFKGKWSVVTYDAVRAVTGDAPTNRTGGIEQ